MCGVARSGESLGTRGGQRTCLKSRQSRIHGTRPSPLEGLPACLSVLTFLSSPMRLDSSCDRGSANLFRRRSGLITSIKGRKGTHSAALSIVKSRKCFLLNVFLPLPHCGSEDDDATASDETVAILGVAAITVVVVVVVRRLLRRVRFASSSCAACDFLLGVSRH